jgi:hypothetical protein
VAAALTLAFVSCGGSSTNSGSSTPTVAVSTTLVPLDAPQRGGLLGRGEPELPFTAGQMILDCPALSEQVQGRLDALRTPPPKAARYVCFVGRQGSPTATPGYFGVLYLPPAMNPDSATVSEIVAAGGLLLEQRLDPGPRTFPAASHPHDPDGGIAVVTIHGQPGFVQRQSDYVFAEWREGAGTDLRDFNLVGNYSPAQTLAFAGDVAVLSQPG